MKVRLSLAWIEFSHGCKRAWRILRGRVVGVPDITGVQAEELLAVTRRLTAALRDAKPALLRAAEGHIKGNTICDAHGLVLNPVEYERAKDDAATLRALAEMEVRGG